MGASVRRKELRRRQFAQLEEQGASLPKNSPEDIDHALPNAKEPTDNLGNLDALSNVKVEYEADSADDDHGTDTKAPPRKARFICFIGNLPFTITTEILARHFAKVHPEAIRHSTSKETGNSRGFAFLEFENYDRLKTCLALYHHSLIDDGTSPARKINVELTAGGGGTRSKNRKSKLSMKNAKLNVQRKKKFHVNSRNRMAGDNLVQSGLLEHDNIHPSREGQITQTSR